MANGHGGSRLGSGRKPKDEALRALDGNAGHRGRVLQHPLAAGDGDRAVPTVDLPKLAAADAPKGLTADERKVWLDLAPHAMANRTLVPSTSYQFALLCRNIVLERRYAKSPTEAGGPNHRGMIQAIDRELLRFNLAPVGRPVVGAIPAASPTVDPLKEKYFGRA